MRSIALAGAAVLAIAVAACASQGDPARITPVTVVDTTTFAPEPRVEVGRFTRLDARVYYYDFAKGSSRPTAA